ncbi:hypothetical protein [Nonomuraea endophytica]|uniref:Uncharacterized protein n=1 Tax=Nonomuraea endophytica TaxID=714136 RepID=A0A7W8EE11_9ACTN|nr:hypothetical protein [Nonomuraea endophytica]MBB5074877.1 hypothetical protein [Nonomuraea endophytica]
MANLEIHYKALDECRTAIYKAKNQYADVRLENNGGKEPTYNKEGTVEIQRKATPAEVAGHLKDSESLAKIVDEVWSTLINEGDQARRKLHDVEIGLSAVEQNVKDAHKATS